ncbi:Chromatin modification- protein meaf6 [Coemansia sp. RSA 2618]|nr:Chromatin modification- protein meaf6 [Coemansia sp. RSA 2618]
MGEATPAVSTASSPPPANVDDTMDKSGKSKDKGTASNGTKAKTPAASNTKSSDGKVTKKMVKEAEQELYQLLLKKKQSDRTLIEAETSIYDFETSYFENSGHEGNIVHGFEGYLNTGRQERRQMHFTDADRIFSQSSATFKKAQEAKIAASLLDSDSDEDDGVARGRRKGVGGSTIKHRQGTPTPGRGTPTPGPRSTKKLRLSIDSST